MLTPGVKVRTELLDTQLGGAEEVEHYGETPTHWVSGNITEQ